MSLGGKIGTFSKLLKENLTGSSRGLTLVSPIFATHDIESGKPFHLLLRYVGFRVSDLSFTATGAGAGHISDALERENQWGLKDAKKMRLSLP
jgi:hypothetical protein